MTGTERAGYSLAQITLHWLIVALVLFQIVFGESMAEAVEAAERGQLSTGPDATLASAHYWVGLAILALVAARLVLRLFAGAPPPVDEGPVLRVLAAAMHWAFYVLLVAVPISGLVAYYLNDEVGEVHALAKPIFIVLIVAHAGAALYHHFVLRDGTLRRMLFPAT